jgi:hypothetical protein
MRPRLPRLRPFSFLATRKREIEAGAKRRLADTRRKSGQRLGRMAVFQTGIVQPSMTLGLHQSKSTKPAPFVMPRNPSSNNWARKQHECC